MDFQNWIKTYVVQIIPLISAYLYIMGFAYMLGYYLPLGVNILTYITLSEVLMQVMALMIVAGIYCLVMFHLIQSLETGMSAYADNAMDKIDGVFARLMGDRYEKLKKADRKLSFANKTHTRLRREIKVLGPFLVAVAIFLFFWDVPMEKRNLACFACIAAALVFLSSIIVRIARLRSEKVMYKLILSAVGSFSVGMLIMLASWGYNNAWRMRSIPAEPFSVSMTDGKLYNQNGFIYLGDTSSAVFVMNRDTNETLILNRESVRSMSVSSDGFTKKYFTNWE